jgi:hypothetical protein
MKATSSKPTKKSEAAVVLKDLATKKNPKAGGRDDVPDIIVGSGPGAPGGHVK